MGVKSFSGDGIALHRAAQELEAAQLDRFFETIIQEAEGGRSSVAAVIARPRKPRTPGAQAILRLRWKRSRDGSSDDRCRSGSIRRPGLEQAAGASSLVNRTCANRVLVW